MAKSGKKSATRQHFDLAVTGKVPKVKTGESTIHPKPYAKGGSVKRK
jgi:hypothetical protein